MGVSSGLGSEKVDVSRLVVVLVLVVLVVAQLKRVRK